MNNTAAVVPFYFNSQAVRTIVVDQEPWFVAKDVCNVLGIENVGNAVSRIPEQHKGIRPLDTPGGVQQMSVLAEPGLYRLVLRSDKPQAEPFIDWVTAEVLPTIRKTGGYNLSPNDKRVFVKVDHSKTTQAPRGLDIRYTLDLGKIVANPTRRSVELLERLTGIQLTDIPLTDDGPGPLAEEQVTGFCRERCRYVAGSRLAFAEVYALYREHVLGSLTPLPVSKKRFSSLMASAGFMTVKQGGVAQFADLQLAGEEVAA